MRKFIICFAMLVIYVVSTFALPLFVPFAHASEYIIGTGDKLSIQVIGQDQLTGTGKNGEDIGFTVRSDGKFDFALIGEVVAAGKTVKQLTEELTKRFAEYFVRPIVVINILGYGARKIYVLGEVKKTGVQLLPNDRQHNVLDALSAAGGFTREGEARWVLLIHADTARKACEVGQNPEGEKILEQGVTKLNIQRLISKGDLSQNVELNEGDFLYVVRNHRMNIFDVIGRVLGSVYQIYKLANGDL